MKYFIILVFFVVTHSLSGICQENKLQQIKDSLLLKSSKIISYDSLKKSGATFIKKFERDTLKLNIEPKLDSLNFISVDSIKVSTTNVIKNFSKDSIQEKKQRRRRNDSTKIFHIGWEDGKVPEFMNAYTLHRHEIRLNLMGRSSFAFTNKLEMSIYIPLLITPNISLKYRFIDRKTFASAAEIGVAGGLFPYGAVGGLFVPGVVVGVGTAGVIKGSDKYLKLFLSYHPSKKLTFSARGSISYLKIGYSGYGGFVALGNDGVGVGFLPLKMSYSIRYFMMGFETDYVINKTNVIVLNSSFSGFEGSRKQLFVPSICWTHARKHLHTSVGLYNFLDPPKYEMWNDEKKQMPIGVYGNIYWIFNNRIKK